MAADVEEMIRSANPRALERAVVTGSNLLIRCPFHKEGQERTPSCSVKLTSPVFFCHGCQENGHLTKLLRQLGMPLERAKKLVDAASFADLGPSGFRRRGQFRHLMGPNPYRGQYVLDEDVLEEWRVVPIPLKEQGFKIKTLRHFEVGFDVDRLRITFPIRNIYGELVGVSGRTVADEEPRYKIYKSELQKLLGLPEEYSLDGIKTHLLWHGHATIPLLYRDRNEPLVITEGFKAAMAVWQAGIRNVVALIGSYFTDGHANLLATIGCPVILFLDNNEAGLKGTKYAIRRLIANETYVANYPDLREQPDALHAEEVKKAVGQSLSHTQWLRENRDVRIRTYSGFSRKQRLF